MYFGFSKEISEDVVKKSNILTTLSENAKSFFETKEYGTGVKTYVIGIICVAPCFEFFFKPRKKYSKAKKLLEYDIKLDHEKFKNATDKDIKEIVAESVVNSLSIVEEKKIKDFDLVRFREDIILFFNQS